MCDRQRAVGAARLQLTWTTGKLWKHKRVAARCPRTNPKVGGARMRPVAKRWSANNSTMDNSTIGANETHGRESSVK